MRMSLSQNQSPHSDLGTQNAIVSFRWYGFEQRIRAFQVEWIVRYGPVIHRRKCICYNIIIYPAAARISKLFTHGWVSYNIWAATWQNQHNGCAPSEDSDHFVDFVMSWLIWTASSEFGTYRLCEQRRFRRACASAQSRQNLSCSLIQAVNQEEPSDRKPDPWPLWMAGHAQLEFVMTECSKTQIRLNGLIWSCTRVVWRQCAVA